MDTAAPPVPAPPSDAPSTRTAASVDAPPPRRRAPVILGLTTVGAALVVLAIRLMASSPAPTNRAVTVEKKTAPAAPEQSLTARPRAAATHELLRAERPAAGQEVAQPELQLETSDPAPTASETVVQDPRAKRRARGRRRPNTASTESDAAAPPEPTTTMTPKPAGVLEDLDSPFPQ